jgi:iron only hydrogenase large subunit-like protein
MSIIQFKEANCKNCYKCIRSCPVNAIAFKNDQAEILQDECILCGRCLAACPQNAKSVKSDIEKVKNFISRKEKVYVSLAPSFASAFDLNEKWLYCALKKLGFTHIEGTANGAFHVSRYYERLLQKKEMKNIITSCCSSIILLIEKYYPQLIGQLAPVVSPMIAHAKMLRETYGERIKVVFIGPCISKKDECNDLQNEGQVDAVLTFDDLDRWLEEEGLYQSEDMLEDMKNFDTITRIYPVPGGILNTIDRSYKKNYRAISVDGIERCKEILDSIVEGDIDNYLIEMSSCTGGCIAGPCMKHVNGGFLTYRERLLDYAKRAASNVANDSKNTVMASTKIDFSKKFVDRTKKIEMPSESVIQGILDSIGKYSKDKELNCGACGYATCREKALAVYIGKAQVHMCLPYMRERAESISNIIINNTPNAIFALDKGLRIQEANQSAQDMFNRCHQSLEGKHIAEILQNDSFERVAESGENIYDEKYIYQDYEMVVKQSIINVSKHNTIIVIINNITEEEEQRQKTLESRSQNIDITQKVIEKQMRVAQEIASLLGETTAETKVALTKLKNSIMSEMGDLM